MFDKIQFLLLQVRNGDDPMREHEVEAFQRTLNVDSKQIRVFDLLSEHFSLEAYSDVDMFLFGGSGHYSAAGEGEWLERALDVLREVHRSGRPTFASCWGFQAMARAMGGTVITDMETAQVGTHKLQLTRAGHNDPVFGPAGDSFYGQMGHQDSVIELPPHTTLLATSDLVENQAYRFDDRPIYCTQFHPELARDDLKLRLEAYPEYIEAVAGITYDEFCNDLRETPESASLLTRFVELAFDKRSSATF